MMARSPLDTGRHLLWHIEQRSRRLHAKAALSPFAKWIFFSQHAHLIFNHVYKINLDCVRWCDALRRKYFGRQPRVGGNR